MPTNDGACGCCGDVADTPLQVYYCDGGTPPAASVIPPHAPPFTFDSGGICYFVPIGAPESSDPTIAIDTLFEDCSQCSPLPCCQSGDCCFSDDSFVVLAISITSVGAFGTNPCCDPVYTYQDQLNFIGCTAGVVHFANEDFSAEAYYDGTDWSYSYPPKTRCPPLVICDTCFPTPDPVTTQTKNDCCGLEETVYYECSASLNWQVNASVSVVNNNCCRREPEDVCINGNGFCDGGCI